MDVAMFTVGPVQENCFILRAGPEATTAVIVDPGEEPDKLLAGVAELGVTLEAILLTHTHFDHVGAVAPVAKATGAPVYCPVLERQVLADIMAYVFQGSVGRTDLPGGDHGVLMASIGTLLDAYPPETTVLPGHMGTTTLGQERATNPFLQSRV